MVALGGHAWFLPGGHAWFFPGGVHGFSRGLCVVFPGGGACVGYDEIRSMSGRYASYWNAFLLIMFQSSCVKCPANRPRSGGPGATSEDQCGT